MLDNIKSKYIIKEILFNLYRGTLLKLVKYNKNLQNKIEISLYNFKIFTGKKILYENNIYGKEYDRDGELLYEGEFLNGQRHGKGIEYNFHGETIFEGYYSKGKRNGK